MTFVSNNIKLIIRCLILNTVVYFQGGYKFINIYRERICILFLIIELSIIFRANKIVHFLLLNRLRYNYFMISKLIGNHQMHKNYRSEKQNKEDTIINQKCKDKISKLATS